MTYPANVDSTRYYGLRTYFTVDATNTGPIDETKKILGILLVSGVAIATIGILALNGIILVGITFGYKLGIYVTGIVLGFVSICILKGDRDRMVELAFHQNLRSFQPELEEGFAHLQPTPSHLRSEASFETFPRAISQEIPHAGFAFPLEASPSQVFMEDFSLLDQHGIRAEVFSEAPLPVERQELPHEDFLILDLYRINGRHLLDQSFLASRNPRGPEVTDEEALAFFQRADFLQYYPTRNHETGEPRDQNFLRNKFIEYFQDRLDGDLEAKGFLKQIVKKFVDRDVSQAAMTGAEQAAFRRDLGDFFVRVTGIVGHCSGNHKSAIQSLFDKYVEGDVQGLTEDRLKKVLCKFLYNYKKEIFTNTILGICNDPLVIHRYGAHIANSQIYYQRTQGARYGLHFPLSNDITFDDLRAMTNRDNRPIEVCISDAMQTQYTKENIIRKLVDHFNDPTSTGSLNDPIRKAFTVDMLRIWLRQHYGINIEDQQDAERVYDFDEDYMATWKPSIIVRLLSDFGILQLTGN